MTPEGSVKMAAIRPGRRQVELVDVQVVGNQPLREGHEPAEDEEVVEPEAPHAHSLQGLQSRSDQALRRRP